MGKDKFNVSKGLVFGKIFGQKFEEKDIPLKRRYEEKKKLRNSVYNFSLPRDTSELATRSSIHKTGSGLPAVRRRSVFTPHYVVFSRLTIRDVNRVGEGGGGRGPLSPQFSGEWKKFV